MEKSSLQSHFDALLTIYSDFSLREFRYKEGKTAEIRAEAKRLCTIYKDQCECYLKEHPGLRDYFFDNKGRSLGYDEKSFFDWARFSSQMGSALARMQEELE